MQIGSASFLREIKQPEGSDERMAIAATPQRKSPPKLRHCRRLPPSLPLDYSETPYCIDLDKQFFRRTIQPRLPIRQKFGLLISKENFGDPRFARFQHLSASIGRFL
jgi:hypothetical protein